MKGLDSRGLPKTCPLCASTCEASASIEPGEDRRPGFTKVRCAGRCGEFLICPDSLEIPSPDVRKKLAWLARLLHREDRGRRLEITPELILVLRDLCTDGG